MRVQNDSLQLTTNLESRVIDNVPLSPSSGPLQIASVSIQQAYDLPTPSGHVSITKLVSDAENNATRREALVKARKKLASSSAYNNRTVSISSLRLVQGWSQSDLAREMETSQPHVARIEAGTEDLRVSTVEKLAKALKVPAEQILTALLRKTRGPK